MSIPIHSKHTPPNAEDTSEEDIIKHYQLIAQHYLHESLTCGLYMRVCSGLLMLCSLCTHPAEGEKTTSKHIRDLHCQYIHPCMYVAVVWTYRKKKVDLCNGAIGVSYKQPCLKCIHGNRSKGCVKQQWTQHSPTIQGIHLHSIHRYIYTSPSNAHKMISYIHIAIWLYTNNKLWAHYGTPNHQL